VLGLLWPYFLGRGEDSFNCGFILTKYLQGCWLGRQSPLVHEWQESRLHGRVAGVVCF